MAVCQRSNRDDSIPLNVTTFIAQLKIPLATRCTRPVSQFQHEHQTKIRIHQRPFPSIPKMPLPSPLSPILFPFAQETPEDVSTDVRSRSMKHYGTTTPSTQLQIKLPKPLLKNPDPANPPPIPWFAIHKTLSHPRTPWIYTLPATPLPRIKPSKTCSSKSSHTIAKN